MLNKTQSFEQLRKQLNRREAKELLQILREDEKVKKLVRGLFHQNLAILVVTTRRIIFMYKTFPLGYQIKVFPYHIIQNVRYESGITSAKIKIYTLTENIELENFAKEQLKGISEFISILAGNFV
ncbi:PH domain-containing protein [Bacillota bacterium LX-D]|nr:PH domain-containing protein [Bacillota bacterium LX-D]